MTNLFAIIFIMSIAIPTITAVVVSIRDIILQRTKLTRRAPRKRTAATILIYHTDINATLRSVRQLRRMRAIDLSIIVVAPAGTHLNVPLPGVVIHRKHSPSSRHIALASAYPLINPSLPLLVIDSGDIVSAVMIHGAIQRLQIHPQLTHIVMRRIVQLDVSFLGILVWFSGALRHSRLSLRARNIHILPAGTWLRTGRLLQRLGERKHGSYSPQLATNATSPCRLPEATSLSALSACTYIAVAIYCHAAVLSSGVTVPVVAFWVVSAWWLFTLLAVSGVRLRDQILAASVIPVAGILLPTWHLLVLGNTLLSRLRQNLTRTHRQNTAHSILFRLSHP